jgi:hypothetical protein
MPDDRRLCRRVVGHAVQLDRPAAVPERRRASTRTDSTRQTRSTSSATAASSTAVRTRAVRPARPCDGRVDHVKPQPRASRKRPLERRKGRRLRLVRPPGSPIRRGLASLADTSLYTFNLLSPGHADWPRRRAVIRNGLHQLRPDVVTLQETGWVLRLRPSERSA